MNLIYNPKLYRQLLICCLFFILSCHSESQQEFRILTAGIAHESNSFIPYLTTEADFTTLRGQEAIDGRPSAELILNESCKLIPSLHARSGPSGMVSGGCYEAFRDEILDSIQAALPLDGILLHMHGALHVEGYPDAQLDFIRQIRNVVGDQVLVAASFDLHGNISPAFMEGLDLISAYRTAPHVDAEQTRTRTARLLMEALQKGYEPQVVHINIPILIPGEKGITSTEPLKNFYDKLPEISAKEGLMDASIFVGMPWTDVYRAGMSVQVVARNKEFAAKAEEEALALAQAIWEERRNLDFDVPTATIDEAIESALTSDSTVFITDSGDNVTAGAAGDNTLVLERLLAHGVSGALLAGIVDPESVEICAEAGVGAELSVTIGGKRDQVFCQPLSIKGKVLHLARENENSPQVDAVLQVEGVTLVLLSSHRAFTDPSHFEAMGLDPMDYQIVVVKEGYLFQGLRDIAPEAIMALTPGFAYQLVEELDYRNIRRPIFPLDPEMNWSAREAYSSPFRKSLK